MPFHSSRDLHLKALHFVNFLYFYVFYLLRGAQVGAKVSYTARKSGAYKIVVRYFSDEIAQVVQR